MYKKILYNTCGGIKSFDWGVGWLAFLILAFCTWFSTMMCCVLYIEYYVLKTAVLEIFPFSQNVMCDVHCIVLVFSISGNLPHE